MIKTLQEKNNLLDQVSSESLMNFTKEISKEVRLSGSEEEKRSFQFAEKVLSDYGFKTNLFYKKALISLPGPSSLVVSGKNYNSNTHSMATSTGPAGISTELVFVGDEQYDNGFSYEGKAVLIEGLATPGAVKNAQNKGAVAAVFINAEYTHEMIVSTVWGNPSIEDANNYPEIPVVSVNYADGQELKNTLKSSSNVEMKLVTEVLKEWRDIPTLIADFTCNTNTNDFLLFSGHIDSWHYGAMDNGSANATMLEVARVISENKTDFQRNLRLAFWSGHSHGRYAGSALYADENYEELYDHCLLHLNIDSVGAINSTVLTEGNTMAETKELIGKSVQLVANEEFEGSRFGRAGDQSFWGIGVPSALMGLSEQQPIDTPAMRAFSKLFGDGKGGGFGWWWHTTEDTLDKIDPENLKRDCQIYLSIVYDFLSVNVIPVQQSKGIEEIQKALSNYQKEFDFKGKLDITLKRLDKLKEAVLYIEEKITSGDDLSKYNEQINEWNKKVSRGLVRLNYVDKDPFHHDPALYQPPVPSIGNLLKKHIIETVDLNIIHTTLQRRINKVNFTLRELNDLTLELINKLKNIGDKDE